MESPDTVSFRTMQDVRSSLVQLAESFTAGEQIPGRAAGIAKTLAATSDNAMMTAAANSGVAGLPARIREANAAWRSLKTTFNDTVIKKLAEAAPEKIPHYVRAASLDDIRRLESILPEETMNNVRASIMRDVLDRATTGELRQAQGIAQQAGLTAEGLPPIEVATLKSATLTRELEKLGGPRVRALFGADATADLLDIARVAQQAGQRTMTMVPGLIAAGINATILSPILHPFGFGLTVGQSAGLVVGMNTLARVLVRQPTGLHTYRAFAQAIERGDVQAATTTGLALTRMLEAEPGEHE